MSNKGIQGTCLIGKRKMWVYLQYTQLNMIFNCLKYSSDCRSSSRKSHNRATNSRRVSEQSKPKNEIVPCMEKPDNYNLEFHQVAGDRLLVQLQNAVIRFFHARDEMKMQAERSDREDAVREPYAKFQSAAHSITSPNNGAHDSISTHMYPNTPFLFNRGLVSSPSSVGLCCIWNPQVRIGREDVYHGLGSGAPLLWECLPPDREAWASSRLSSVPWMVGCLQTHEFSPRGSQREVALQQSEDHHTVDMNNMEEFWPLGMDPCRMSGPLASAVSESALLRLPNQKLTQSF